MSILFPCGCLSKAMGISCWVFNLFSIAFFVQIADILRDKSHSYQFLTPQPMEYYKMAAV